MKKWFAATLLVILLTAREALCNLSVSPFYLEFDALSQKRADIVRLTNSSNEEKTYRIKLVHFIQNKDGSYAEVDAPHPDSLFAAPHLDFAPRETTLAAGQSQTIRIQRRPMPTAPDGEYVAHLLIQEQSGAFPKQAGAPEKGLTIDIRAVYGITIPIIITKGNLSQTATIKSVKLTRLQDQPIAEVSIARKGTRSFFGTIIVSQGKKEIGRVNNFRIFLSSPERTLKVPLTQEPSGKIGIILQDERKHEILSEKYL